MFDHKQPIDDGSTYPIGLTQLPKEWRMKVVMSHDNMNYKTAKAITYRQSFLFDECSND
jgi:hypothetical protein